MKIPNPFKLQNWKFKKFLIVMLFFQISLLGLFALNNLGVDTPIIRPLIGFIYLTIIPGYLLLRILKLYNLDNIESFLYAIGLSLFLNMFVGFLMNMFCPILGITDKPIAEIPIILTMAIVVGILSIVAYIRDRDYEDPDYIPIGDIINPQVLFLSLIPFMAIFGTYLVNYYNNNILLMVMIVTITLVSLIVGSTNWINEKYYPYAIWVMAISLVWHITLITPYVLVRDVLGEYYVAKYICEYLQYWDFSRQITVNYNSVLSISILPIIYSKVAGISLNILFKAVFPMIYSIIFIGIFNFYKNIFNNLFFNKLYSIHFKKLAFISTLVVLFFVGSFRNVPITIKQSVSEVFMILFVLYIFKIYKNTLSSFLFIAILFSIVVSHYGVALLLFGYTLFLLAMLKLMGHDNIFNKLVSPFLVYIIIFISWYSYISNGSVVSFIINVFDRVVEGVCYSTTTGELAGSRGAHITLHQYNSPMWILYKFIHFVILLFTIYGALKSLKLEYFKKIKDKKHNIIHYRIYIISALYWGIIMGATVLPYFSVMSPYRIFHIFLIFSAPLFVYGFLSINKIPLQRRYLFRITLVVIILLIFSTEFIFDITRDNPTSFSISQQTILLSENINQRILLYRSIMFVQDVESSKWSTQYIPKNSIVYRFDSKSAEYVYGDLFNRPYIRYYYPSCSIPYNQYYIHLTLPNTKEKIGWNFYNIYYTAEPWPIKNREITNMANKIYSNLNSEILWVHGFGNHTSYIL